MENFPRGTMPTLRVLFDIQYQKKAKSNLTSVIIQVPVKYKYPQIKGKEEKVPERKGKGRKLVLIK